MQIEHNDGEAITLALQPNSVTQVEPDFCFRIRPHRAMTDRAFALTIVTILSAAALAQLYFIVMGIWVAGVAFILDGLFLAAAFIACRSDLKKLETVSLQEGMIFVRRSRPAREDEFQDCIPAFGLEIAQTFDPDYGHQRIELRHRGRTIEIGGTLSPPERQSFSKAFVASLQEHGFNPRFTETRFLPTDPQQAREP